MEHGLCWSCRTRRGGSKTSTAHPIRFSNPTSPPPRPRPRPATPGVSDEELKALAGRLKKRCGVGGSAKGGVIELQGDHRDAVVEILRGEGYDVVLAGG